MHAGIVLLAHLLVSDNQTSDQEKILALLASWSFYQKPTAERGNFSIKNVLSITKELGLKAV